jgi:hypothetical protein
VDEAKVSGLVKLAEVLSFRLSIMLTPAVQELGDRCVQKAGRPILCKDDLCFHGMKLHSLFHSLLGHLVTSFKCNNWAKRTANGRMLGYWPGSAVHQRATLAHPRFEDFDYASNDADDLDCLAWMGNGMIQAQEMNLPTTGYLNSLDVPPVPVSDELQQEKLKLSKSIKEEVEQSRDIHKRNIDGIVVSVSEQVMVESS